MTFKETLAKFLARAGVPADLVTWLGLLLSFTAACAVLRERFLLAGIALLSAGALDMLDGAVARASGKATAFGGILDSSLDRYGDGFVLGAVLMHFMALGELRYAALALSALLGSFAISYVRARAECEMDDCRIGFWERGERVVLLVLALLFNRLEAAMWILGLATHWTVFQRLALAKLQTEKLKHLPFFLKKGERATAQYYLKVTVILAILFFLPF